MIRARSNSLALYRTKVNNRGEIDHSLSLYSYDIRSTLTPSRRSNARTRIMRIVYRDTKYKSTVLGIDIALVRRYSGNRKNTLARPSSESSFPRFSIRITRAIPKRNHSRETPRLISPKTLCKCSSNSYSIYNILQRH